MTRQPLFLTPIFQERVWGGTQLQTRYKYDIPSSKTGECWAISAHPHGESVVRSGEWEGYTLKALWEKNPALFGFFASDRFPLLTKILDANDDLSVQVHPDDENAWEIGELGKTECWYILDCDEKAEIILGHTAQTKEEFLHMIKSGEWNQLLTRIKIQRGDFFYVPSGTIHALCRGTLVLETQQSSDTTYRVYDYERMGLDGQKRDLHINEALRVTKIPHCSSIIQKACTEVGGGMVTTFVEDDYFSVYKWDVASSIALSQHAHFMLASVIEGEGELVHTGGNYTLKMGDHFILPYEFGEFTINGNVQLIASHPNTSKVGTNRITTETTKNYLSI